MIVQYILFYASVGLLLTALMNFFIILNIRLKGETVFYKLNPKSPEYGKYREKYRRRASNKSLLVTLLVIAILLLLMGLEAWAVIHKHAADSVSTLVIGSIGIAFLFLVLVYKALATFRPEILRGVDDSNKHHKGGSWLV
jgi:accessory gene regulator protein AgrB